MNSILETAALVAQILEQIGVPYFIAGSAASSIYGLPRATQDVDFVASLEPEHVPFLVAKLEGEFYVDETAVREAVAKENSFNIIRWATMDKVDVFVRRLEGFTRSEFERRQPVTIKVREQNVTLYVASAEDTLLYKLLRIKKGGEVSERQWADIVGILKVQDNKLDWAYLTKWASEFGILDLLHRAARETESEG